MTTISEQLRENSVMLDIALASMNPQAQVVAKEPVSQRIDYCVMAARIIDNLVVALNEAHSVLNIEHADPLRRDQTRQLIERAIAMTNS